MKKYTVDYLLGFLLGTIIFGTTGVIAIAIMAGNVSYDNSKTNMKDSNDNNVVNIQDAIDNLYVKASNRSIPEYYKLLSLDVSATSSDILNGKTAYKQDGSIVSGNIGTYDGSLSVTPSTQQQVLQTSGKYLSNNITINAIPNTSYGTPTYSYKNSSVMSSKSVSQKLSKGRYVINVLMSLGSASSQNNSDNQWAADNNMLNGLSCTNCTKQVISHHGYDKTASGVWRNELHLYAITSLITYYVEITKDNENVTYTRTDNANNSIADVLAMYVIPIVQ